MADLVVHKGNTLAPLIEQENHIKLLSKTSQEWNLICSSFPARTFDDVFNNLEDAMSFEDIIKLKLETTNPENAMKWQVALLGIISNCIISYLNFINRNNTMSREQVMETARLIYDEYPYITVYDLSLYNDLIKKGKLGELKDLNGTTFIRWFDTYFKQRFDRYNEYQHKKEQEKLKAQAALQEPELSQEEINIRFERLQKKLMRFGKATKEKQTEVRSAKDRIKKIRLRVIAQHTDILPLSDYDKRINALIEEEIAKEGLLEEYNKLENK